MLSRFIFYFGSNFYFSLDPSCIDFRTDSVIKRGRVEGNEVVMKSMCLSCVGLTLASFSAFKTASTADVHDPSLSSHGRPLVASLRQPHLDLL